MENIWIYDLETYPNFFSATFKLKDNSQKKVFYCFESEVNQLPELRQFIYQTIRNKDFIVGFNNKRFDNIILGAIMNHKEISIGAICALANDIINSQNDYGFRSYAYNTKLFINSIDLMAICRLDKLKKSLKQIAIFLNHNLIQDLPIKPNTKVKAEDIETILKYNENDVDITLKLYQTQIEEIKMRFFATKKFNINLMSSSRPEVGDAIFKKLYCEITGVEKDDLLELRCEDVVVHLSKCILPNVKFQSRYLNELLEKLKSTEVNMYSKFDLPTIKIGKKEYVFGKGGLHSVDEPAIYKSNDSFIIKDADVTSYYPNLMIRYGIKPELCDKAFLDILESITKERVEYKKLYKETNDKQYLNLSEIYKIVVNSIFGKLNFEYSWFRDPKALLSVTLNGQLFLIMLIEKLNSNGIEVISANTDGVTCYFEKDKLNLYKSICNQWESETKMDLEFVDYSAIFRRDVNNYMAVENSGKVKQKGFFDTSRSIEKEINFMVITKAVNEYFLNKVPVEEFIKNHKNIYDFCTSPKCDSSYQVILRSIKDGNLVETKLQKTNRFFCSKTNDVILKQRIKTKEVSNSNEVSRYIEKKEEHSLLANEGVTILNENYSTQEASNFNIKYSFYIKKAKEAIEEIEIYSNPKQLSLF